MEKRGKWLLLPYPILYTLPKQARNGYNHFKAEWKSIPIPLYWAIVKVTLLFKETVISSIDMPNGIKNLW